MMLTDGMDHALGASDRTVTEFGRKLSIFFRWKLGFARAPARGSFGS